MPTTESWMRLVARNIALGDIVYHPDSKENEIFNGVHYTIKSFDIHGKRTKMHLLHDPNKNHDSWDSNFQKYLSNLYVLSDKKFSQDVEKTEDEFFSMMSNFDFLPNSPTLMNAGRALQQLSACFVLPVDDSIEGIFSSLKNMAMIHKSGGGTGFNFSRLRPANDEVKTTKGVSSGPISFMSMFDKSTDVVKQGGTRRGANMGILRYDHPDILKFITCKNQKGFLENFNISVAVDKKFMEAVKKNEEYNLLNPRSKEPVGKLNAREVFDLMVTNAWVSGDPGFIVIDLINESDSNPTPAYGEIEATNPCGEQPLLPFECCNLGSINLSKFVKGEQGKGKVDYDRLKKVVHTATHFLDNVIEISDYPLPEIEEMAKLNRRIGLGVMGFAEMLVELGIAYNSEEAYAKAEEVMKFINDESLNASCELAEKRGVFPNFVNSIYDKKGQYFRGTDAMPRNAARTTIAPTGTIGIAAGIQGAGIEPFFAVAYVRYNAAGIDALKAGRKPDEKDTFFEINPQFQKIAEQNNFFGLKPAELWSKIEHNHKSVIGLKEVPEKIQKLFLTSHDLSPMEHVKMQVAFQHHVNNAVSKTVNLRNEATPKDIEDVYMMAYELGAKGVTIYRDGSKDLQILNTKEKKTDAEKDKAQEKVVQRKRGNGFGESSSYYEVDTGYGPLHVHVNYDEIGPTKIFANISPIGTEISGLTTALGIIISKYFEIGGDPKGLIKHLNSIKGDKPFGLGQKRVDSIPHAVSKILRDHLVRTGFVQDLTSQTKFVEKTGGEIKVEKRVERQEGALYCPKCFSPNVEVMAGCSKPTCFDCGYSECG